MMLPMVEGKYRDFMTELEELHADKGKAFQKSPHFHVFF